MSLLADGVNVTVAAHPRRSIEGSVVGLSSFRPAVTGPAPPASNIPQTSAAVVLRCAGDLHRIATTTERVTEC